MTFQYVLAIVTSLAVFFLIIFMLRSERLKERHALWWLIASFVAVVFSIFPQFLTSVSDSLGFDVPSNFLFFVSIVILFLVALQVSTELTGLEEKTRTLAEKCADLEFRLDDLEKKDVKNEKNLKKK